jgi:ribosomal protein S12 methylthiotransferase
LKKHKINIVTLGCSKNLVDSELLMRQLASNKVEFVHNSNNNDYNTVIINTCGFINDAKEESVDTILQYVKAKSQGIIKNIYVTGCMSERYKNELKLEIPEVDEYFGVHDLKHIVNKLGIRYYNDLPCDRLISTPGHYAYLKISEGCDRSCSFCAIPLIRGRHISKPVEEIIREATYLADAGIKELILIAQDLTYYGYDIYYKPEICRLLEELVKIEKIHWIRLHYSYPANFPVELIDVISNNPNICNYFDIPVQHISDEMLQMMRRGIDKKKTIELLELIRKKIPGAAIRTTIMTGHPGETENNFNELKTFVRDFQFNMLGVFKYSEEQGTYSSSNFPDIIPEEIKEDRASEIMKIQQGISYKLNRAKLGSIVKVIVDHKEENHYVCRTEHDSPEVDNEVLICTEDNKLEVGNFYNVKIISVNEFDLYATVQEVSESTRAT